MVVARTDCEVMTALPVTFARACTVALGALLVGACTNTVVPPPAPAQPVSAFLLDHGRHASLVVEREDGLTRWSYGDWAWYAENRTGPFRASGTLFGSNRAALGRRELPGPAELAVIRGQVVVPVEAAWRIDVPARRAQGLNERLQRIFDDTPASRLLRNPLYDLDFAPHPEGYSAWHNSNHVTAEWLRALGCTVEMAGPYSIWQVEQR